MNESKEKFEQVLIGSLLGDGNIQKRINKNNSCRFIYRENHSIKQKQYALLKANELSNYLSIKIREIKYKNNKQITFWSKKSELLKSFYNHFYKDDKKSVNEQILNKIGPLALAIWYSDDGNYGYHNKIITSSTESFSLEENKLIQLHMKKKYNLNFILTPRNNNYRLRLNTNDTKKFIKLIKPFIFNCMNHKLGMDEIRVKKAEKKRKIYHKEYYQKHKEKIKKQVKRYGEENKEEVKKKKKEHRQKNITIFLENERKYRKKNRKRIRGYNRKYYKKQVNLKDNLKRIYKE